MSVANLTLRLLEALYQAQGLSGLLAAGVDLGCWAGARWRDSQGSVTHQVGAQDGAFVPRELSLGWLELSPAVEEPLMARLAPFLDGWLEGQCMRRATPTLGCWIDLEEGRFLSLLPGVRHILGFSAEEFLSRPVPHSWLEVLSCRSRRQAILYLDGPQGQPIWIDATWTPGTQTQRVCLVASDVSRQYARSRTGQALEKQALLGDWDFDLASGEGRWSTEASCLLGLAEDCPPSLEMSLRCFPQPARAELEAAVERAMCCGEPYELELPVISANGEDRWLRVSGLPVCQEGKVARLHGVFRDVTSRVELWRQLTEERDRLRAILDTIPDLVWLKCPDGRFLECNSRFQSLYGSDREGVLGKTDYDFVDTETADFFRRHDLLALQASETRRNEEWVRFESDGHQELLETIKRPLYERGRLVGVLGIGRDLTENFNVRRRLQESQERLRLFLENAPAAVAMFDRDMRYLLASHRFAQDYGLENDNLTGLSHYEVFPEIPTHWREAHARCLAGSTERCEEDSFLRGDGSLEWVRWEIHPWYEGDGRVGGLILFSEVITAAKNAELALRNSEERFQASQRMEAVGRLAGGVAHDFNNLLTVIVSCTELARMDLSSDHPVYRDLEEILVASKRAESLTRQLLIFSRSQIVSPSVLDLRGVLSGLSRMLHRLIGEDVEMLSETGGAPCWVLADQGQLEQVLMNLVVNARDAMPHGGQLRLSLDCLQVGSSQAESLGLRPGEFARLRVEDNGAGMDDETRQRMFEPFFTTKGLGKGTGLGLSTVYGIVQRCQGSIDVDSVVGRGTRMDIYLPLQEEPGPVSGADRLPVRPPHAAMRILVIEDEPPLRAVLKRVLQASGYEVFMAGESAEALDLARNMGSSFELILSDIILPGMSGCELMEHLRPLCPRARHLFMSGYTDDALERFQIPRERVLAKPFDQQTLTTHIHAALTS